jgi:hypothetical protein
MRYENYRYLWPARPERVIPPSALAQVEAMGWWAQPKLNGANCTLYVSPERTTLQRHRHGDQPLKTWQPGARWDSFVQELPVGGWYVFQSELLHTKGTGRDTLYLYDLLVTNGDYLVGRTYRDRYHLLLDLCGGTGEVTEGVFVSDIYTKDFAGAFATLQNDHRIEGLVCKNPEASLLLCSRSTSNSSWQVKCRYPKANLSF